MRSRCLTRLPLRRRFGAAAALLALLFASISIALPHAAAVAAEPAHTAQLDTAHPHDDHADHAAHRHGAADHADASHHGPAVPESGCSFCKDCTLCNLALADLQAAPLKVDPFERFAPAAVPLPAKIDPAPSIEPPRV